MSVGARKMTLQEPAYAPNGPQPDQHPSDLTTALEGLSEALTGLEHAIHRFCDQFGEEEQ
jgi:hypothetical protein